MGMICKLVAGSLQCPLLPKTHTHRVQYDRAHCCDAASNCLQCLGEHERPVFPAIQRLLNSKLVKKSVLQAQTPCAQTPKLLKS